MTQWFIQQTPAWQSVWVCLNQSEFDSGCRVHTVGPEIQAELSQNWEQSWVTAVSSHEHTAETLQTYNELLSLSIPDLSLNNQNAQHVYFWGTKYRAVSVLLLRLEHLSKMSASVLCDTDSTSLWDDLGMPFFWSSCFDDMLENMSHNFTVSQSWIMFSQSHCLSLTVSQSHSFSLKSQAESHRLTISVSHSQSHSPVS